jgi:Oxidoreductase family, NAD-binding Rossmann fold
MDFHDRAGSIFMRSTWRSMSRRKNTRPNEQQAKLIKLLNRRLADAIDLQLQSRQAYWNVNGSHFMALRELFDKVAQGVEEFHVTSYGNLQEMLAHEHLDIVDICTPSGQHG